MDKVLSMEGVHPRDRVACWHDLAGKNIVPHTGQITSPSKFDATIETAQLGELGLMSIETRGLTTVERTAYNIARDDADVFLLCVSLHGSATLLQDGRETVIHPGDFALLDAQRPFVCRYEHRKQITIKIPHRALKTRLGCGSGLTARAVRSESGIGALASSYIRLIPKHIDGTQPAAKSQIAEQLLDLAALALAEETGKEQPSLGSGRALTLLRLRTAIETRLGDPDLDPGGVAAAVGISVRYANSLLAEQDTSLRRLIISRRLEQCRRTLENPAHAHRSITEIAFAWGFSNTSHFDRRFKAAYGCSPGEHRRRFLQVEA